MGNRVFLAAGFSSAYCVLTSSVYFTIRFALASGQSWHAHLWSTFQNVLRLALFPAAAFGFLLGGLGALIMTGLGFNGKIQKSAAAAVLGGILGCLPPAAWPPPQDFETPLSAFPCILIGSTCAFLWALLTVRATVPAKS